LWKITVSITNAKLKTIHGSSGITRKKEFSIQSSKYITTNKGRNMLDTVFWIAVGAFVGWNFPQPFWAKMIQEKIRTMLTKK